MIASINTEAALRKAAFLRLELATRWRPQIGIVLCGIPSKHSVTLSMQHRIIFRLEVCSRKDSSSAAYIQPGSSRVAEPIFVSRTSPRDPRIATIAGETPDARITVRSPGHESIDRCHPQGLS